VVLDASFAILESMLQTFLSLLKKSWELFAARFKELLIASVVMGVVLGSVQYSLVLYTQNVAGAAIQRIGITEEQMREWAEGLEAGDPDTIAALEAEQEKVIDRLEAMTPQERDAFLRKSGFGVYLAVIPMMLLALFINGIGVVLMLTYFFLAALHTKTKTMELARQTFARLPTMFVLWLWVFVRCLFWVPVINIFAAILWGPRVVFAGLLQLQEQKGAVKSVQLSYDRTKGQWSHLITQLFLLSVVTYIAWSVAWHLARLVEKTNEWIGLYVHLTILFLSIAYMCMFILHLQKTLKK